MIRARVMMAAILAIVFALVPTTAHATVARTVDAEVEIERLLEQHPGGVEIAPGRVSWDDGAVILTLEGFAAPLDLAACASGRYCAWSGYTYTGSQLSFSSCSVGGTTNSLSALGTVRSIANMRSSGHVDTGSYTLGAGDALPSVSGVTSMTCYT